MCHLRQDNYLVETYSLVEVELFLLLFSEFGKVWINQGKVKTRCFSIFGKEKLILSSCSLALNQMHCSSEYLGCSGQIPPKLTLEKGLERKIKEAK